MAFVIEQQLDDVQHHYDPEGDVLYISFGPPTPAISVAMEDWFLLRIAPDPPRICGFTFIGFKRLFSNIRPDLIAQLPDRVKRLERAHFVAHYSDEADTLAIRFEKEQPVYYERFEEDIYVERSLASGEIVGIKVTHYTTRGTELMEKLLSAIFDALFAPVGPPPGPADALTRAFLKHLDVNKLLALAA